MSKSSADAGSATGSPVRTAPPPRAVRKPAPMAAHEAQINSYLAAYIMGIANRLANGASQYYRAHHNLGMAEWRALMAIGHSDHRIVREVAQMADLDYAAASKSLKLLAAQGLVSIEQTRTRGRAAYASLTPQGAKVFARLKRSAARRQDRLLSGFSEQEIETLWSLLRRVEAQIRHMNAPD